MIKVSQKTKFDLKNEKKDRYILVCHIFFSTMSAQRSTYLPSFVCSKPIYGSCPRWNKIQAYQCGVPPTGRVQPIPRVLTESDTY